MYLVSLPSEVELEVIRLSGGFFSFPLSYFFLDLLSSLFSLSVVY